MWFRSLRLHNWLVLWLVFRVSPHEMVTKKHLHRDLFSVSQTLVQIEWIITAGICSLQTGEKMRDITGMKPTVAWHLSGRWPEVHEVLPWLGIPLMMSLLNCFPPEECAHCGFFGASFWLSFFLNFSAYEMKNP